MVITAIQALRRQWWTWFGSKRTNSTIPSSRTHYYEFALGLVIVCTVAAGCAAKAYDTVSRPNDVAIVRYDTRFYLIATRRVHVVSVDGTEIRTAFSYSVELVPGIHTLKIDFQDVQYGTIRTGKKPCWITAYFHGGREYQIESEMVSEMWRAWMTDKTTGEIVGCLITVPGKTV